MAKLTTFFLKQISDFGPYLASFGSFWVPTHRSHCTHNRDISRLKHRELELRSSTFKSTSNIYLWGIIYQWNYSQLLSISSGQDLLKVAKDIDLEKGCVLQNLTCNEVSATSFIPISLVISKKNYSAKPKNPVLDFPKMNNWFKIISGS